MIMNQTAELRQCTTLFINITIDVNLFIDNTKNRGDFDGLKPFITRSEDEIISDNRLLNELQMCMKIVTKTLIEKSGQIRQFIHDDKGTVCIGTIGLRGSTTENNSAAAVVAAKSIIHQLQLAGMDASIGIASGLAFCGLVGSSVRHEYAVMGPSVNLSARLMSAAGQGCILCDQKTRDADRRHKYQVMSAISAKGYDGLVSIFAPLREAQRKGSYTTQIPSSPSPAVQSNRSTPMKSFSSTPVHKPYSPVLNRFEHRYISESSSDDDNDSDDTDCTKNNLNFYPFALRGSFSHGLFGRGKTLTEIFAFLSLESKVLGHMSFRAALRAAKSCTGIGELSPHPVTTSNLCNQKMKLLIISGPYGIGKSALLEAVCSEIRVDSSSSSSSSSSASSSSSSSSSSTEKMGYIFKYYIKADSYDIITPFLVWKKILSYLLSVIQFDTSSIRTQNVEKEQEGGGAGGGGGEKVTYRKAVITSALKRNPVLTREFIIEENVHTIIKLMDPALGYLKPLLFNGFLSDSLMSLSTLPLSDINNMTVAEKVENTTLLLAGMFQKISEVLGGQLLFAM